VSAWVIVGLVAGYIAIGAVLTVSVIRVIYDKYDDKYEVDASDSGYIAGISLVWPVAMLVLLFALFGRFLVKMIKKGGGG
jgi:hypothetical protein